MTLKNVSTVAMLSGLMLVMTACGEMQGQSSRRGDTAGKGDTAQCYDDEVCGQLDDCCNNSPYCPSLARPMCSGGELTAVTNGKEDGCVRGFACVTTDAVEYEMGLPITVTVDNMSPYPFDLPGCTPVTWVPEDGAASFADRNCLAGLWQGTPTVVAPGETFTYTTSRVADAGRSFRLQISAGLDCAGSTPGSCQRYLDFDSNAFSVGSIYDRCLAVEAEIQAEYNAALAEARECTVYDYFDGLSQPQCTKSYNSDLRCGGCPTYVNPANTGAITKVEAAITRYAEACGGILWQCARPVCALVEASCGQDGSSDLSAGLCTP